MLQFIFLAIHYTRTATDSRRISGELFTKFSKLIVINLSETPAPYSCLFPPKCAKISKVRAFTPDMRHSHQSPRGVLVRPDQLRVEFA
jgi:hypothetical protein